MGTGMVGTLRYMAPENALMRNYNQKVDVYSWALIFWSCLTLEKPYDKMTRNTYLNNVCRLGHRPLLQDNWYYSICCLIEKSWAQESCDRITMAEVCEYLQQIKDEIDINSESESTSLEFYHNRFNTHATEFLRCNAVVPFAA